MTEKIKNILKDLYEIDPMLKPHEKNLIKIIQKLLESTPDVKLDSSFVKNLRTQLLSNTKPKSKINLIPMKNFIYGFSGAVISLLIVGTIYFGMQYANKQESVMISFSPTFEHLEPNAFGNLYETEEGEAEDVTTQAGGLGGGGGIRAIAPAADDGEVVTEEVKEASDAPLGSASAILNADEKLITPETDDYFEESSISPYTPTTFKYVYVGDDFALNQTSVDVLKRIQGSGSNSRILSMLSSFDFGLIDMNVFKDVELQSLNLVEDRDFGYSAYINFVDESVSISENWEKWPQCYDEECYRGLDINDIPSDTKLRDMANSFLSKYKVDLSSYGKDPKVNDYWTVEYERSKKEGWDFYVPDYISLQYPLMLNDKPVYYEGGTISGLDVNINIRHMRVSGFWNLTSQNYESSSYEAVTDKEQILDIAGRGGWNYYYYEEPNAKVVEIKLGTPEEGYMKYWRYDEGSGSELIVPALIFPIVDKPTDEYLYRDAIAVPLAKDLLDGPEYPDPVPLYK